MGKKFICDNCKRSCVSDWSEEDAMAEYEAKFGKYAGEELGVLCDDCQKAFDKWFDAQDKKDFTN